MTLDGKKVVVIGGSSGIGLSAAKFALQEGADVTIGSRSLEKLEATKDKLGGKLDIRAVDTTEDQSVSEAFGAPLDYVITSSVLYRAHCLARSRASISMTLKTVSMRSSGGTYVLPNIHRSPLRVA